MAIQINTKSALEKELVGIFEAWRQIAPGAWAGYRKWLREMAKVQKNPDGSFVDEKGRVAFIKFNVPVVLWRFFQHRIPDWGSLEHINTMLKVFKDFDTRQNLKYKRFYTSGKRGGDQDETQRSDDSKGRDDVLAHVLGESS